ncbi:MAG TPA: tetratricopeptide repeat protein [Bryobacteraceae bacterium]|nr:tetratricopeptide repeat protein [Bryobacteraceae bacterium]
MYRFLVFFLFSGCAYAQSSSPQELLKQAIAAQQSGHFDEAVHDYRLILEKYPNIFEIRSNLGASLAGEGLYTEAVTEYKRALSIKPNPQVRLNLALAYYKLGNFTLAASTLRTVHAEERANLQALTLLADCYLKLGENKKVIDLLTPIQQSRPDDRTFIYLLGTALVRDGQTAKGQVIIDKILRDGDSAESKLLMGTAKFMVADYAGARDDFQRAIQLNSSLPEAFAYYGMALLSTGDQAGARKAFEQELKSDPNNFVSNLHMGVLLREDQDYDGALKYLHHALEIRPGDPGVRFQIASVESAQNRLPEAGRDLEALVKDSPDFIEAHVALATVYFREKRKADGERERAIFARLNAARSAKNEVAVKTAQ